MTPKCSFERRSYPPGQHGRDKQFRRGRASDYLVQLREKQKARRIYGVLERQFSRYFERASKQSGLTGTNLLVLLETRLDNVVYRLGFADSRAQARQIVAHGHIMLNGRRINVAVGAGTRRRSRSRFAPKAPARTYFKDLRQDIDGRSVPRWLSLDTAKMEATTVNLPERQDIDTTLNEQLIVEYYSR